MKVILPLLALVVLWSCSTLPAPSRDEETAAAASVLDDFHDAAAHADEERYFAHFAAQGVFFGTDAKERWPVDEFRKWAHPHFANGKGWTFTPAARHVYLSDDGTVAWFDEVLQSASFGECRGTGVLQKFGTGWKVEQYNLTIPIPNELADEFVRKIREAK